MIKKFLVLIILMIGSQASLASFDSYIVKDKKTKKFSLVKKIPNGIVSNYEYIEPNYIIKLDSPNSEDSNATVVRSWHLSQIGMSSAIEKNSKNSKAIKVAVIDSGIDWTHPDLENHVDISHGFNFIDHSNNAKDDNGHGTHVAGIIAANCNNIVGTCGIMRNAILLPLKFLTFDGKGTTFGAVEAIEYAVKMKVDIINASWGSFENSQSLKDAIKDAQDAGILFVTASGNYSANNDLFPEYPASFPLDNIISVTATDEFDRLDDFANFGGHSVHVAAPGKNILSTYLGGKYESLSGTSMATPIVTGMLGLLKQYHPQSNFIELKNSLINGCFKNDVLSDKVICKGRVDLRKSLGNFLK